MDIDVSMGPDTRRTEKVPDRGVIREVRYGRDRTATFLPPVAYQAGDDMDIQVWQDYAIALVNGTVQGIARLK